VEIVSPEKRSLPNRRSARSFEKGKGYLAGICLPFHIGRSMSPPLSRPFYHHLGFLLTVWSLSIYSAAAFPNLGTVGLRHCTFAALRGAQDDTNGPMPAASVVATAARQAGLFRRTPLIKSTVLTDLVGRPVYLKLDNLQASGSFKDRGVAHLCQTLSAQGVTRVISSSGGNAGLAVATVAPQLGMDVEVYVPETTKQIVVQRLEAMGASVTIHGINWNAADALARKKVEESKSTEAPAAYISPYDDPLLWTGHSTLVDELLEELQPSTIVVSVGGGGLLCGLLEGLQRHEHTATVIAAETTGANCFAAALAEGKPVRLQAITSVATSLGALETTPATLERSAQHKGAVQSALVTDSQAVDACLRFAADHRLLVEPACGTALAVAYDADLREAYFQNIDDGPIVIEVCGGSGVNLDILQQWKTDFGL
jgi:L-serine/L-threonine ammonia-lyase